MTDAEKKMKKYTNAVERRLNLPRAVKARVMSDFLSSIAARREAGRTDEEIYAELGDARKAAADLNEQMKEFAYRKSPWRFLFLGLAVVAAAQILYDGIIALVGRYILYRASADLSAAIGIIGGADGPTAFFVTTPSWMVSVVTAALLIVGIAGYLLLRHCKAK
ncbi:MAG: hypothetical protein Q4D50_05795 [Eubacteriales bacterium]|nr:hypothetical protein [Eubacteriales bacterium]